jgi:3-oxoacyl-[acyl-carrier protein] reductase
MSASPDQPEPDDEGDRPAPLPTAASFACVAGLAGRGAVVTGGSRGIGAATARRLAAAGARVVVVGRDAAALHAVVDGIADGGGTAHPVVADVTDEDAVGRLRDRAVELLGEVDLLAAVAGGSGTPGPLVDLTLAQWHEVVDQNLTSTFLSLRAFLPAMVERGRGAAVTVSSTAGRAPSAANPAYSAAKAAIAMLTRATALQVAAAGVRVNCVAPGATLNDQLATGLDEAARAGLAALHPLGRIGEPDDLAQAVCFLLSDDASWVTGATLDVSGGRVML